MPITQRSDGQTFNRGGFTFRPAAVPSRGSTELAIWELEVAPAAESEPHSVDREEVFLVTSGNLTVVMAGEILNAGPGDAVIVKPNVSFHLANGTGEVAKATCVTSVGMRATIGDKQISPPWAQ